MKILSYFLPLMVVFGIISCSESIGPVKEMNQLPHIFPDYIDVTIPPNIAPLNFQLKDQVDKVKVEVAGKNGKLEFYSSKDVRFSLNDWKRLLNKHIGSDLQVTIKAKKAGQWLGYKPFSIHVATEKIDPYLAYRLIEPGYEFWTEMGIYQRNLENFEETPIVENVQTGGNCVNCHSFCNRDPQKMLLHMRVKNAGTIIVQGDKITKYNTKTPQTISALVYPSWHPSGRFIAFSTNETRQMFHAQETRKIEVIDNKSDVVVFDTEKNVIFTSDALFSSDAYETFPSFSPDGKTLYYCSAPSYSMPESFDSIRYSLCAVSFDPATRQFGPADTLENQRDTRKSASFPRVSPDGRYLLYTLSRQGNFSIWHKEADLFMIDLKTRKQIPMKAVNSDETESYHSWSSNSRWFVFSSRRADGLYTRPFFSYVDKNGNACKPFMLPQQDPGFYDLFLKSYNIPELVSGKVTTSPHKLEEVAKNNKGIDVVFQ